MALSMNWRDLAIYSLRLDPKELQLRCVNSYRDRFDPWVHSDRCSSTNMFLFHKVSQHLSPKPVVPKNQHKAYILATSSLCATFKTVENENL